ncbi:MAG: hypothetical protein FWC87_10905 [Acidimicrobiaceae bacterium]|nr:hypothetical protein [Acidimicrobiaceae bacterium]
MSSNQVLGVVIAVAVAGLVIARQVQPRPVSARALLLLPLVLIVIGVVEVTRAVPKGQSLTGTEGAWLAADLALGAVFGVARGFTVRLYEQAGELWRRGTKVTVALWGVTIAARIVISILGHHHGAGKVLDDAVLLTLGITLGAQSGIVMFRGSRSGVPFAVRDRGGLGP